MLANIGLWSFVGGGLALAGTAVYVATTRNASAAEPQTGIRAAPLLLANGGGLSVGGSF